MSDRTTRSEAYPLLFPRVKWGWQAWLGWRQGDLQRDDSITLERADDHWEIALGGQPFLHAYEGGTGACWNIREADDPEGQWMHVCDLGDLITALEALKASGAHAANEARWR